MRLIYLRYQPHGGCEGPPHGEPCRFLPMCRRLVAMDLPVMCELPDEVVGIDASAQPVTHNRHSGSVATRREEAA